MNETALQELCRAWAEWVLRPLWYSMVRQAAERTMPGKRLSLVAPSARIENKTAKLLRDFAGAVLGQEAAGAESRVVVISAGISLAQGVKTMARGEMTVEVFTRALSETATAVRPLAPEVAVTRILTENVVALRDGFTQEHAQTVSRLASEEAVIQTRLESDVQAIQTRLQSDVQAVTERPESVVQILQQRAEQDIAQAQQRAADAATQVQAERQAADAGQAEVLSRIAASETAIPSLAREAVAVPTTR